MNTFANLFLTGYMYSCICNIQEGVLFSMPHFQHKIPQYNTKHTFVRDLLVVRIHSNPLIDAIENQQHCLFIYLQRNLLLKARINVAHKAKPLTNMDKADHSDTQHRSSGH